uniref:Uncharacterized protein n=1 Tax=Proboscia inermis TaxID=420281 RepID=A0A7S0CJA0_9STRA|mmetsp:Transcript_9924/g.11411  ORF Transcript_9924/g.11411 Transcript_9924/m.11411 type:complete len:306 (-) Transcript_9924:85-1002(-)
MASPTAAKFRIFGKLSVSLLVPAVPVGLWWKNAVDERECHTLKVATKVRIPNVQTVDDLMVEKCEPGDVILFDRRWENCASGPIEALNCLFARSFLCGMRKNALSVEGTFDHAGIVVPGAKGDELYLLEATAGEGVTSRPLLARLEMSRSKSVILLPLSSPGEKNRRNVVDYDTAVEESEKTIKLRNHVESQLSKFRNDAISSSIQTKYKDWHSLTGIVGSLGYAMDFHRSSPKMMVSPSAWLVASALQNCGAAANVDKDAVRIAKVEDFLQDHRFNEIDSVRLRPGWNFLPPVIMREGGSDSVI